ncbi:MAG TPA: ATP-binding protein, partial [Anaerolineales bacterium]|nr:ATP-binding protein [Anaerolineales bacterium]
SEVRPRELAQIAAEEVDALLSYLHDPSFPIFEHGDKFCKKGLSDQTLLGLARVTRQFFLSYFTGDDVVETLNIIGHYQNGVVRGFIKAREQMILEEQERIRGALQIAVGRYTVEIKEVQEIAQKANEANEFKTQFIARMSHELRTPLGALLGLAEMLQQNVYGALTAPQQDIVKRIISNAEELKQVFTELLDQSQIESGQLRLRERPFSPEALARRVNSNYLAMALQKGLSMRVEAAPDLPKALFGDEARIAQVLSNLVVNAIKFTKKGGVTIRVFKGDDSRWSMQVKDTGIGIAPEDQGQIFEPFRQADESTSRKYGGVGLGLAIAQQLVQAMKGSIHLESKPGLGSTFTVSLPIRESEVQ